MHSVFISYHHDNDQEYKEALFEVNGEGEERIFIDGSVDTGDISDNLSAEKIREKIRDEYLRDTSVTIVLVGSETKKRKHIDWEIYSSMFDGPVNKKSGILVVILPSVDPDPLCKTAHDNEKVEIYPEYSNWVSIDNRAEYEKRYPYLSDRIIDNLLCKDAKISVVPWSKIENNRGNLQFFINATFNDRVNCKYDMHREMMRQDL